MTLFTSFANKVGSEACSLEISSPGQCDKVFNVSTTRQMRSITYYFGAGTDQDQAPYEKNIASWTLYL